MTATQPGPLSAHWLSTMSSTLMPRTPRDARQVRRRRPVRERVSRRCPEGEHAIDAADGDEPGRALLHDPLADRAGRPPAASQAWQVPRVGCPAKGSSPDLREDAHRVVGRRIGRRQQEGRLGQVGPAREALHLLGGQARCVVHDRDRVAAQRMHREDIDLLERAHRLLERAHRDSSGWAGRSRIARVRPPRPDQAEAPSPSSPVEMTREGAPWTAGIEPSRPAW